MPKVKNAIIGALFLGLAAYAFLQHASPWTIGLLFAASVYLLVIAFTGLSAGGLADLQDAVAFVRNPTATIVDRAGDVILPHAEAAESRFNGLLSDFVSEVRGQSAATRPAPDQDFDPDAIVARYLAARPQAPAESPPAPAAPPSFGRKKA